MRTQYREIRARIPTAWTICRYGDTVWAIHDISFIFLASSRKHTSYPVRAPSEIVEEFLVKMSFYSIKYKFV